MMRHVIWTLSLALAVLSSADTAAAQCRPAPSPVRDLALERYYTDDIGSVVDAKKVQALRQVTAPLQRFVTDVSQYADRANTTPQRPAAAACGLRDLSAWADGGAYLGTVEGKQSQAQRRWDLAGLSLAYLKLRKFAAPEQRAKIDPWLGRVTDAALAAFDDAGVKRNNHWYWMGVGCAAVAIATESDRYWQCAKSVMTDAATAIAADGTLPLEMARGTRALHYHAFASMALVTLAELGFARGEDWYALGDGALHRLVGTTVTGINDARVFDALANIRQETPVKSGGGWIALYESRFPGRLTVVPQQNASDRRLGGRADVLVRVLALLKAE